MKQLQAALRIQPFIISNGREDGWIMPSHLATMGFYPACTLQIWWKCALFSVVVKGQGDRYR